MSEVDEGNVESCSTIKDGSGRLAVREDEYEGFVRSILKVFIT